MTERSANPSEKTRKSLSTLSICPKSLKNKGKRRTNPDKPGQTRTNPDKPGQGHAANTSGTCVSSDMVDMVDMVDMTAGQIGKQNTPDTRIMSPLVTAKKPEKNAHSENRAAAGAAFYARNSHVAHT